MGKECLKCGYVRMPTDSNPDYECPKCGAIYAKVEKMVLQKSAPPAGQNISTLTNQEQASSTSLSSKKKKTQLTVIAAGVVALAIVAFFFLSSPSRPSHQQIETLVVHTRQPFFTVQKARVVKTVGFEEGRNQNNFSLRYDVLETIATDPFFAEMYVEGKCKALFPWQTERSWKGKLWFVVFKIKDSKNWAVTPTALPKCN